MLIDEPTESAAPLKILDFGIARATGAVTDSGTGTGLGTPRYMAPEQITSPDTAGEAADLYSLSVLFYELLVDVLPQGHWQPPSGGRPDIPQAIDRLIESGLSNRPANRPQSAGEYRDALVKAVNIGGRPAKKKKAAKDGSGGIPPALQWIGGITAAIAVLVVIGSFLPEPYIDPCEGLTGQAYQQCAYGEVIEEDEEPEPPKKLQSDIDAERKAELAEIKRLEEEAAKERERLRLEAIARQRREKLASLNGQWNDGLGTVYSIQIDSAGRFTGSGFSTNGYALSLAGNVNTTSGTYTVSIPQMNVTLNGNLRWGDKCHLNFQTFAPGNQSVMEQGLMHVNHPPGAPCPN